MTSKQRTPTVAPRHEIRLAVLQPTSMCNLNCSYCYVPDRKDSGLMSDAVLKAAAAFLYQAAPDNQSKFNFLWHAGEPLTAGIAFYRRAFEIIDAARPSSASVSHTFQTNGTLVSKEWCAFLMNHNVHIGISIDGPQAIHDANRSSWSGRGSFKRAMRGYDLLKNNGYDPAAICVLTPDSLTMPDEIYDFFRDHDFPSVGFNLEESEGAHVNSPYLRLTQPDARRQYVRFMQRIWDRRAADGSRLRIREFDQNLSIIEALRRDPNFRATPDEVIPFANITIRRDGGIGTFAPELMSTKSVQYNDFVLGNVLTDKPSDVLSGTAMLQLWADLENGRGGCRDTCAYFAVCGGGFQSNRYAEHGTLTATDTTTCRIHCMALFDAIVSKLV
ncbi:MAG: cyclophane-forming radical SAM/SPASM peptide maturase GrrM/OscB [Dehalococcoidia bacterium]